MLSFMQACKGGAFASVARDRLGGEGTHGGHAVVVSDNQWPSGKGMHGGRGAGPGETCKVGNFLCVGLMSSLK